MDQADRRGKIDLPVVLFLPIAASIITLRYEVNYFFAIMLFLGIPALYLSWREPRFIKKTAIFSLVASIPAIIVIDYIGQLTNQWIIPDSISAIRIFGITQIEQLLWAYLSFYVVVMYYEHFLDRHFTKKVIGRRFKYLFIIALSLFCPFLFLLVIKSKLLEIPYFYFVFGLSLIAVPAIFEPYYHKALVWKVIKAGAYFFYLSALFEYASLSLNHWIFPGNQYIGWLTFLDLKLPYEELIFWILLFALAILAVFEKYDDDEQ